MHPHPLSHPILPILFLLILSIFGGADVKLSPSDIKLIKQWADGFGTDLVEGSQGLTCIRYIEDNYRKKKVEVKFNDPTKLMEYFKTDVENMFGWKRDQVRNIVEHLEIRAFNSTYDEHLLYPYINSKKLYNKNEESVDIAFDKTASNVVLTDQERSVMLEKWRGLDLKANQVFQGVGVNMEHSAIHVPVNVYDQAPHILNSIKWSESVTSVFRNNRNYDSDTSWQFFCSDEGFLRLYPASKWRTPKYLMEEDQPLDLYDCRMRNWFIEAAASAKDVIILYDESGSMTGQRKEIGRNVVYNILDSLSANDYVTVLRFNNRTIPAVECFGENMVRANPQNIRLFKESLRGIRPSDIGNFNISLTKAFEILQSTNRNGQGAGCNQAIMLVTDGAPSSYKELFERYNYPRIPIRVFTYLVGKEVKETEQVTMMACDNRGYYTHVANNAEVREQVQDYIPVMARPLVLEGSEKRPYIYTSVYADVTDVPLNNWVWDARQKEKIRIDLRRTRDVNSLYQDVSSEVSALPDRNFTGSENLEPLPPPHPPESPTDVPNEDNLEIDDVDVDEDREDEEDGSGGVSSNQLESPLAWESRRKRMRMRGKRYVNDDEDRLRGTLQDAGVHDLMMTIAAPVYDKKKYTIRKKKKLVNNKWIFVYETVRSAKLLGVAGIDIPIRQIVRLTPAYKIGVNGYSFAINNNGYVLYHPDLRPLFKDLLKPYYSSVDVKEVELEHTHSVPRQFTSNVLEMRKDMLRKKIGWKSIKVKQHFDFMKRVTVQKIKYYYRPVDETPFTLAMAIPESYGQYAIKGETDVKLSGVKPSRFFKGSGWRVHPDWRYCTKEQIKKDEEVHVEKSPEQFIHETMKIVEGDPSSIRWKAASLNPLKLKERSLICDKDLLQGLVYDAEVTDIDAKVCGKKRAWTVDGNNRKIENQLATLFGVPITFVATRSGLTRVTDHQNENNTNDISWEKFANSHNKAIEETFYRRAVDYYERSPDSFVFSIPFDANQSSDFVMGTKAIFFGNGKQRAPAAVVGVLFNYTRFRSRFFSFIEKSSISSFGEQLCSPNDTDHKCYLIDNNGYVIVNDKSDRIGQFFGEVDSNLFKALVGRGLFKAIPMFDYQAICIKDLIPGSHGAGVRLLSPFQLLPRLIYWFYSRVSMLVVDIWLELVSAVTGNSEEEIGRAEYTSYYSEYEDSDGFERRTPPNKTVPYPCDKQFTLYEMPPFPNGTQGEYGPCHLICKDDFVAEPIPYSNLLLVVATNYCEKTCDKNSEKAEPKEVIYNDPSPSAFSSDASPSSASPLSANDDPTCYHFKDEFRVRPKLDTECMNQHQEEQEIEECGAGWRISSPSLAFIVFQCIFIFILYTSSPSYVIS